MGSVATLSTLLILWFNYWGRCYPPEKWVLLCAAGKLYHRSRFIAQRWINLGERKRCRGGRLFPEQSKRDGSRKVSSECLNHLRHFPELLMRCHFQESMFSSSFTISITKTKVSLPRANVEILPYISFLPVEFPQANSLWENSFLSTSEHDPGTHPPSHLGHSPGMNDTHILSLALCNKSVIKFHHSIHQYLESILITLLCSSFWFLTFHPPHCYQRNFLKGFSLFITNKKSPVSLAWHMHAPFLCLTAEHELFVSSGAFLQIPQIAWWCPHSC